MTSSAPPSLNISPGWSLVLGILLVIAGIVALVYPVVTVVAATFYIGWFAIIAGVIDLVVSVRTRNEPNLGWRIAVGILYLVLGFLVVAHPIAGAATLALVIGGIMAASGVVEIMLAMRHKPKAGWGWLLASGILAILFAVLIAIGWPATALVLIGYLIGFQIISCGVARIALGMAAKKLGTAPA
jgi:uncharacterized membrane protein HdeD (DUF308 family)